jgi:hypothetical protein
MAELSRVEKMKLEKMFDMNGGYVMDFSNRTFSEFIFEETRIEIYDDKYCTYGDSKAKRLRAFWDLENNYRVGKVTKAMLDEWRDEKVVYGKEISTPEQVLWDDCEKISRKLLEDSIIKEIDVIREIEDDRDITMLSKSIKESISKNQPEEALDRLHTYLMKFIRNLCNKHEIEFSNEESLNALFGKYVKFIVANQKIESLMAERILKYSINVLEAFNDIRNNKSFAHDNPILNYEESVLIFNNVTNSLKFIESVEEKIEKRKKEEQSENIDWDDLPF